jgi:hypothetical protein
MKIKTLVRNIFLLFLLFIFTDNKNFVIKNVTISHFYTFPNRVLNPFQPRITIVTTNFNHVTSVNVYIPSKLKQKIFKQISLFHIKRCSFSF